MKKLFFTLSVIWIIFPVFSQKISIKPEISVFYSNFSTGKDSVGYQVHQQSFYEPIEFHPTTGAKYGLHIIYSFSDRQSLNCGLNYIHWGGQYRLLDYTDPDEYFNFTQTIESIELPILYLHGFPLHGDMKFIAGAGFSLKHTMRSVIRENDHYYYLNNGVKTLSRDTFFSDDYFSVNSLGLVLQAGINKKIRQNLSFYAGIEWNNNFFRKKYRLFETPDYMSEEYQVNYNLAGINLGIIYTFDKNQGVKEPVNKISRENKMEVSTCIMFNPVIQGLFNKDNSLTATKINLISNSTSEVTTGFRFNIIRPILSGISLTYGAGFLKVHGNYTNTYILGDKVIDTTVFSSRLLRNIFSINAGLFFSKKIPDSKISFFLKPFIEMAYSRYFCIMNDPVDMMASVPCFSDSKFKRFGYGFSAEGGMIYHLLPDLSVFISGEYSVFNREFLTLHLYEENLFSGHVRFGQSFGGLKLGIIF